MTSQKLVESVVLIIIGVITVYRNRVYIYGRSNNCNKNIKYQGIIKGAVGLFFILLGIFMLVGKSDPQHQGPEVASVLHERHLPFENTIEIALLCILTGMTLMMVWKPELVQLLPGQVIINETFTRWIIRFIGGIGFLLFLTLLAMKTFA